MTTLKGIENYKYIKELGFGIAAYVSLAQHKDNHQFYAIKCFQLRKRILPKDIPDLFYIKDFSSVISKRDFNKEVDLHQLLNSKSVGPKLYISWIKNGLGYMGWVFEKERCFNNKTLE